MMPIVSEKLPLYFMRSQTRANGDLSPINGAVMQSFYRNILSRVGIENDTLALKPPAPGGCKRQISRIDFMLAPAAATCGFSGSLLFFHQVHYATVL